MNYRWLTILTAWLLMGSSIRADLLAGWELDGLDAADLPAGAPYEVLASTGMDHVQAVLRLGDGVGPSTTAGQYGFKVGAGLEQSSLAGAIDAGHYLEFVLQADAGFQINLASVSLNGESSGTGADNVALLSGIAGFSEGNELAMLDNRQGITGGWDTDSSGWGAPFDLSGEPGYQGLGSISFRLYGWNTSSGSGVTCLRNLSGNDLEIAGTVMPIPEPTVVGLISLVGIGLIAVRRFII